MEVSGKLHTSATLALHTELQVSTIKRPGGPQSWSGYGGKEKCLLLPGITLQLTSP